MRMARAVEEAMKAMEAESEAAQMEGRAPTVVSLVAACMRLVGNLLSKHHWLCRSSADTR